MTGVQTCALPICWDLYARGSSIEAVTLKNCVAFENGHNLDGSIRGNGNGFKLGGENMSAGHTIVNSVAFNNDANGITCNSCPDIKVINCTSFNNNSCNYITYSNATNTDFVVSGSISFRDSRSTYNDPDSLRGNGTQDMAAINQPTNYFWDGSKSVNTEGVEITADMFESLEFKGFARKADGSVDLGDFLKLTDKAPADAGAREGGDADYPNPIPDNNDNPSPSTPENDNPPTGVNAGFVVAMIGLAGAAVLTFCIKRRRA